MRLEEMTEILGPVAQEDLFKEQVGAICGEIKSFKEAQKAAEDDSRDLVLAIVGRVKSGKSSFLNALLFNGDSVLPEAATPMTAALTFIRYDETCHAEVEFFSEADWRAFESKAANYAEMCIKVRSELEKEEEEKERRANRFMRKYVRREITDALINERLRAKFGEDTIAAVELVRMARENGGLNGTLDSLLGKRERIIGNSPQELATKLGDYVGAKGRFTPIVCSTTIYLNDKGMKGYCVIDTPGTNDPVISRGKKTQDNLKKADVVLVMSPAGRFFDDSDLRLCSQNLPASGIKEFIILISQFDVSIGEVESKIGHELPPEQRMKAATRKARTDLVGRYRQCIGEIAQKAKAGCRIDADKWQRLCAEDPILVSAMAFIIANHWGTLNAKERELLDKFNSLIPGFAFDKETLLKFSMMGSVEERLNKKRAKKSEILEGRKRDLAEVSRKAIGEKLSELASFIKAQIETLETSDIAKLQSNLKEVTKRLERGSLQIKDIFADVLNEVQTKFTNIIAEISESQKKYANITVHTETRQGFYQNQVNRFGIGILDEIVDGIFGPKMVTYSYTYPIRYADAYQAVDQVDAFATKAKRLVEKAIASAIDVSAMQKRIAKVAIDILCPEDADSIDMDIESLKLQIKSTVRKMVVPPVDFEDVDYSDVITGYFSGNRVEEDDIEMLREAQHDALHSVIEDLTERIRVKATEIEKSIKKTKDEFVDSLIGNLKVSNEQLASSIKDKAAVSERWKRCLRIVEDTEARLA